MSFDQTDVPALPNFDLGTMLDTTELHALAGVENDAYFKPQHGALRWAIESTVNGHAKVEVMYADQLWVSDQFAALAGNAESWRADHVAAHFAQYATEPQSMTDRSLTSLPIGSVPRMQLARDHDYRQDEKAGRLDHVKPAIVTDAQQVAAMVGRSPRMDNGFEILSSDVSVIAPLIAQIIDGASPDEAYVRVVRLDLSPVKLPTETRTRAAELAGRVKALDALSNASDLDWIKLVPAARDIFRRSTRLVGPANQTTYAAGTAMNFHALLLLAEYGTTADRAAIIDVAINSDRAVPPEILDLIETSAGPLVTSRTDRNALAQRLHLAKGMVWQGNDRAASDY